MLIHCWCLRVNVDRIVRIEEEGLAIHILQYTYGNTSLEQIVKPDSTMQKHQLVFTSSAVAYRYALQH